MTNAFVNVKIICTSTAKIILEAAFIFIDNLN